MKEQIIEEYKKKKGLYDAYRERIINLITDLLFVQQITPHQITGRTKSLASLSKKIDDKGEKYNYIDDITDIIGLRIITYMESDVDAISQMIEREFIKDEVNSVDKRKLKSDQFGYRSLHVVVSLNENRFNLKEYRRYKNIKCEIQIRSILQHAWAEIEHDLGYKGEISIPEPYKRTFNRLSALLESADIEFDRLKLELANYENKISELITLEPELVDINKTSINSFINSNPILLKARTIIEEKTKVALTGTALEDIIIKRIKYLNFETIAELEKSLTSNELKYLDYVRVFVKRKIDVGRQVLQIAPLMYFLHFLISALKSQEKLDEYFEVSESSPFKSDYSEYIEIYEEFQQMEPF